MKEHYRKLCAEEPSIPIFSKDWWLDAVAGENWDVALVKKGGKVLASMPYVHSSRLGFNLLSQPALTQTLGPWLRPSSAKYAKRLSQEKDLMNELINQLPPFHHFSQNWNYSNTNWLPFFWRGFSQTTRYTYVIPDLHDGKNLWDGLLPNIRTDIKKAKSRFALEVNSDAELAMFLDLNRMVFSRQGKDLPYTELLVKRIDQACGERNCRRIFIATDEQGRAHAGVYIIWDECSAYYLMGGSNPELRNSGATSLCMWEAIQFASTVTQGFDFEGSMLEPVERFFRAFGAVQTPYFAVSKTSSKLLRTAFYFRDMRTGK